ncbi:MAG: CBS and ACT domain-containing protein [Proteobacteria bacterium]|nr:CBS and ACT domain-containing protein [Pseudomonadota bacterium]MBU1596417.1 CBS and ACT domain-containing protein [Pseudomonadota bacterium]
MLVKDWMAAPVFTVGAEASISEVVNLMREKQVKHIPVVDEGALLGVISDRDIKQYTPSKGTSLDIFEINYLLAKTKAREIMRAKVLTTSPETPVEEAAMVLYDNNIGCLPVVEGGRLVGIISDRDMYRVLVEITGARRGGVRVSLPVEDRPGSIREVGDLIRTHGFRLQSILSSNDKAAPGQRYVVLRVFGNGDQQALRKELESKYAGVRFKGS